MADIPEPAAKKVKLSRSLFWQLLFVTIAFTLMVLTSFFFVDDMMRHYLQREAENMLIQTQIRIIEEIREAETVMIPMVNDVRALIMVGGTPDDIRNYFIVTSEELYKKEKGFIFAGFHGYFEAFDDLYIPSPDRPPPTDTYDATTRPWFIAAEEAGGKVAVSPIYYSKANEDFLINVSVRIFGDDGVPLGVMSMYVRLDNINHFVINTRLTEGGYGFLANHDYLIIAHPEEDFLNTHLQDISSGLGLVYKELDAGGSFVRVEDINYNGVHSVFYCLEMENGWYLGLITPSGEYYSDLHTLLFFLSVLGAALTLLVGALLVRIDISKNKADAVLREQRLQLMLLDKMREIDEYTQIMFDTTPMSCVLWTTDNKIVSCNREAMRLFGVSTMEEYTDRFIDFSPEYQPCGRTSIEAGGALLRKAVEEGYAKTEWIHQTLDGVPMPCEVTYIRIKHRDKDLVAGYTRDLREQKAYIDAIFRARDEAEAASRAKSVFLANMSHEIRTPMNSIIGFAELAQDGEIPESTARFIANIEESAKWLLRIINDILDISKIEAGRLELENIPFDLNDIFEHCQAVFMPRAGEKRISLFCYAEPATGKILLGDPVKLRQVLINMLSNAVKFTDEGSVKLLASVKEQFEDSIIIKFEVKDTGIGMTPEQISTIFEPFKQADESFSRKYGGTGLGLAISKNILEMMGAVLTVKSAPGEGSSFSFDVRFSVVDAPTAESTDKYISEKIVKPDYRGEYQVLVCEDNNLNRQMINSHLKNVGLRVFTAGNGAEGAALVNERIKKGEKPFDLIFMDIHMPVMDGLEAAAKITATGIKTPIIALTANILTNELDIYEKSGMTGHLGKPFTSQELWLCLMKHIKPADFSEAGGEEEMNRLQRQLKLIFVKDNQNTAAEIKKAIDKDQLKLVHRLVHTLKSNAGQINEKQLQKAAYAVEHILLDGKKLPGKEKLDILEAELNKVLEKYAPLLAEEIQHTDITAELAVGEIRDLFSQLEVLLEKRNPECINLLEKIHAVHGAGMLAQYVEGFKFKQAIEELEKLKESMEK